jgi:protein TonB
MPVYAPTPGFAVRRPHPRTLVLIAAVHAVALAAVMTAKMDLPARFVPNSTDVIFIDPPKPPPPPPEPQPPVQKVQPRNSAIDTPPVVIPVPRDDGPVVDTTPVPPLPIPGPIGPGIEQTPPNPIPLPDPVRVGPRFITPADQVRPPYPDAKRRLEQEASLRLRLSIDPRGRVVAVEPVGPVDPTFLAAARKHLLAHWRYSPATEDGRAISSSTVITLRFELEE